MKKEHYAAFKFSIINSLISENQSFPTLIDLSSNSIQKNLKTTNSITFIPDEIVDLLFDIPKSTISTPRKRKRHH